MEAVIAMALDAGSPAHAGIDRTDQREPDEPMGFPRTRGDRPYEGNVIVHVNEVPPHTRG